MLGGSEWVTYGLGTLTAADTSQRGA
jgi:hypothetical protein